MSAQSFSPTDSGRNSYGESHVASTAARVRPGRVRDRSHRGHVDDAQGRVRQRLEIDVGRPLQGGGDLGALANIHRHHLDAEPPQLAVQQLPRPVVDGAVATAGRAVRGPRRPWP